MLYVGADERKGVITMKDYKVECFRKDGTPFETKGFVVTDKEIIEQVLLIWNTRRDKK